MKPGKIEFHRLKERIIGCLGTEYADLVIHNPSLGGVGAQAVSGLGIDQIAPVTAEEDAVGPRLALAAFIAGNLNDYWKAQRA